MRAVFDSFEHLELFPDFRTEQNLFHLFRDEGAVKLDFDVERFALNLEWLGLCRSFFLRLLVLSARLVFVVLSVFFGLLLDCLLGFFFVRLVFGRLFRFWSFACFGRFFDCITGGAVDLDGGCLHFEAEGRDRHQEKKNSRRKTGHRKLLDMHWFGLGWAGKIGLRGPWQFTQIGIRRLN